MRQLPLNNWLLRTNTESRNARQHSRVQYIEAWTPATARTDYGLMEDAATAEICTSIWQWIIRNPGDGTVTKALFTRWLAEAMVIQEEPEHRCGR